MIMLILMILIINISGNGDFNPRFMNCYLKTNYMIIFFLILSFNI